MTLKMYQITDFPSVFEKVKAQRLPFKTAYKLTLLAQEIEKHINFYQEKFREIVAEYGQKDKEGNFIPTDDGQGVKLLEGKAQEVYDKIKELRELDVELPDTKLSPDAFGDVELTPLEMNVIMPFIDE